MRVTPYEKTLVTITKNEIISSLRASGLTFNEAEVFIALLHVEQSSASTLCGETGLQDSKVYSVLDSLLRKGMIVAKNSRPKLYASLSPEEAIANLKNHLTKRLRVKTRELENLTPLLMSLYEKEPRDGKVELAYVTKGLTNVMSKMQTLVNSSRREIVFLVSDDLILQRILKELFDARSRGVTLNIAATNLKSVKTLKPFANVRFLHCPCCLLISDMQTLLMASHLGNPNCYAIVTQDPNMMAISKEHFENPNCCSDSG